MNESIHEPVHQSDGQSICRSLGLPSVRQSIPQAIIQLPSPISAPSPLQSPSPSITHSLNG
eukprot:scaffold75299_cov25-Prasinocladus_malaysianus.AAC.1